MLLKNAKVSLRAVRSNVYFCDTENLPILNIANNLLSVNKTIPDKVSLVAVSKQQSDLSIMDAYMAGQRIFGENKAQELVKKHAVLPSDIEWHFIGHLQSNKIRYIASFISLIHSIDGINLLKEVNKEALKNNRVIDCLLQFHIATEESKFGMNPGEAIELLESDQYQTMKNIRICGVMGMSSFSQEMDKVRQEFRNLHDYFIAIKDRYFKNQEAFHTISMGMSGDYTIAIEEGSTMVRIGTAIFGDRNYS